MKPLYRIVAPLLVFALILGSVGPVLAGTATPTDWIDAPADAEAGTSGDTPGVNVSAKASATESDAVTGNWGEMPAPADSVTASYQDAGTPWWGHVLRAPFYLILLPLGLIFDAIGALVVWMDEAGWVYKLSQLLGPRPGPYGLTLGIAGNVLDGLGVGVTAYHNEAFGRDDNRIKFRVAASTNGSFKTTAGLRINHGTNSGWDLGVGYRLKPRARYFGLGPQATVDQLSYYAQTTGWVGATYLHGMTPNLHFQGTAQWTTVGARAPIKPKDQDLSIEIVHAGDLPPGFDERTDGMSLGLGLVHDNSGTDGRPMGGGIRILKFNLFESLDEEKLGYYTGRIELQQFFPLWHEYRALALRGWMAWLEKTGDDPFPFQRLYVNDDPDQYRGYLDFRWRDRGITGVNAEYRYPIWATGTGAGLGIDAVLFGDVGQVFGHRSEIRIDNLTWTGGAGLRFVTHEGFGGRFDVAFSRERTVVWLSVEQMFQFDRDVYFNGRNPIPLR